MKKTQIQVSSYQVESNKIPICFDNTKLVQISDFHNKRFENDNEVLVDLIKDEHPDLIVITGDYLDSRKPDLQCALSFLNRIKELAPVYYVFGNHEARFPDLDLMIKDFTKIGVKILRNEGLEIQKAGDRIWLYGVDDPRCDGDKNTHNEPKMTRILDTMSLNAGYRILLSHRPELFNIYCSYGFDLIFSGHAHGGQFRFPLLGGLFAPSQGFFPKYTAGKYKKNGSVMFVSRGLGDSVIPIRIGNKPELVCVTLKRK